MRELVKHLAHIGYQVSNLERSLAFYLPLGFEVKSRYSKTASIGEIEVAFIELGGVLLELYQLPQAEGFDVPRCGIDHIALEVSDLQAVAARLETLGYKLDEGPVTESSPMNKVNFLLIRGPDGERLEFDQTAA